MDAHDDICLTSISKDDPFFAYSPLFLEIGMGKGDFIIGMSEKKEGHYLGLERDPSITAVALKKIVAKENKDIRVMNEDFDLAYEQLKGLSFDGIFLNFSDPWPKKRHHKRRLTTTIRLSMMASLLKEDGCLKFKTDNDDLYEFTLEQIEGSGLTLLSNESEYKLDEENDCQSEYEASFRKEGKPIHRIIMRKGE